MTRRVALVTGGMGGIGSAICKALTRANHTVITTFHTLGKEAQWLDEMRNANYDIHAYPCDVTDIHACQSMVEQITQEIGAISILVNNAGITRDGTFRKMSLDDWNLVIRTNLDSMFNVSRPVIGGMLEQKWGRVINISSINGQKGQFGQVNYSAAKAGIHGFTMALAQEVASKGVTVNTISPGYIATEMVVALPENMRNTIIAQIPVGRLGQPEEVASLVAYLASDLSGFITGANLAMNGGQHTM